MKRNIPYFLLLILLWAPSQSQILGDYNVLELSESLRKNAHSVIRHKSHEFVVSDLDQATYRVKEVITFLSSKAENKHVYSVAYDMLSKVKQIKATVYNEMGMEIRSYTKNDFTDQSAYDGAMLSDNRYKFVEIYNDSYPYTVSFEYELISNNLLFYPYFAVMEQEHQSVQNAELLVSTPLNIEPHFKSYQTDVKPEESKNNYAKKLHWKFTDLPAIRCEQYGPRNSTQLPHIILSPAKFSLGGHIGSCNSWQDLAKFYYSLNQGRDELSLTTKTEIDALINGITDRKKRIKAIYEYVQNQTRYVSVQLGVGGWQTFEASYVEENKYGDCKALTNYTQALLQHGGIESTAAIVRAGSGQSEIDPDFPVNRFNHVILMAPLENDTVWLECTSQTTPFNFLGSFTSDRHVLLSKPDGDVLVRTPAYDENLNQKIQLAKIIIGENGNALTTASTIYSGVQQERIRTIAKDYSDAEQKEWLMKMLSIPSFMVSEMNIDLVNEPIPTAQLDCTINIRSYAAPMGSRFIFNPAMQNRKISIPKQKTERKLPVTFRQAFTNIDTNLISIPNGYMIENMKNEPIEISSPFGYYYAQSTVLPSGELQYVRKFQMYKHKLPPETFTELVAFFKAINKADKTKIVLLKKE